MVCTGISFGYRRRIAGARGRRRCGSFGFDFGVGVDIAFGKRPTLGIGIGDARSAVGIGDVSSKPGRP